MSSSISFEEAVRWYRAQPNNDANVRANYFDLPVSKAVQRYAAGEEWAEVQRVLGTAPGRSVLDVGAGFGTTSLAFAKDGWTVTALEPDPSNEVGAGAIRSAANELGVVVSVVEQWGEHLPFADNSFDVVFGRQVLHHARDLEKMIQEVARVVRFGGQVLFTREHVADNDVQLAEFREAHPLHHLYHGENAFPLERYQAAFTTAGLQLDACWGYVESILNYHPGTERERQAAIRQITKSSWKRLGRLLVFSERFRLRQSSLATLRDQTPGRIYSFFAKKCDSNS